MLILKPVRFILPLLLIFTLQHALANPIQMQPGLWEIKTSSKLLALVPLIPAEQMEYMQDLAKTYGLEMPDIENDTAISHTCMTPAMVTEETLPSLYQEESGCVSEKTTRKGNSYLIHFSCNGDQIKGQGFAKGTITSAQTFSGNTHFKGQAYGSSVDETADISGKWVSQTCKH